MSAITWPSWTWGLLIVWLFPATVLGEETIWSPLIDRLVRDGHDPTFVRALFSDAQVRHDPQVVVRKLAHLESKLDYGRFLRPGPLARAKEFLETNREVLGRIEADYGVASEIEVAILLIETDLGNHLGKALVFNILANMALSRHFEEIRPLLSPELVAPSRIHLTRKRYLRNARWAYQELDALLRFTKSNGQDPLQIQGSIFGAFGICQFIPSSALRFGVDGDADGSVDLFKPLDALASMANYLRANGWRPGLSRAAQEAVIYSYNRSQPYVRSVLAVADRLKQQVVEE